VDANAGNKPARMTVADRLFLVSFKPAHQSHLRVKDPAVCASCAKRPCTALCPAGVYEWLQDSEGARLVISFENCLECGACRLGCPDHNLDWSYPAGGYGVTYRYG
jgi:ferredoxin like protein